MTIFSTLHPNYIISYNYINLLNALSKTKRSTALSSGIASTEAKPKSINTKSSIDFVSVVVVSIAGRILQIHCWSDGQ